MIGFIGGTGRQGKALALRMAETGQHVILGSRSLERAEKIVSKIKQDHPECAIIGGTNFDAAQEGDIVFVTLPYRSMEDTIKPLNKLLKNKIVVDVINPPSNNNSHRGISASEELQKILDDSKVVSAFKNVSSCLIYRNLEKLEVESIVCSDHEDAKKEIIKLSESIGIPTIDGDGLDNSLASELLTRLLLQLNKKNNAETGIKFLSYKV